MIPDRRSSSVTFTYPSLSGTNWMVPSFWAFQQSVNVPRELTSRTASIPVAVLDSTISLVLLECQHPTKRSEYGLLTDWCGWRWRWKRARRVFQRLRRRQRGWSSGYQLVSRGRFCNLGLRRLRRRIDLANRKPPPPHGRRKQQRCTKCEGEKRGKRQW